MLGKVRGQAGQVEIANTYRALFAANMGLSNNGNLHDAVKLYTKYFEVTLNADIEGSRQEVDVRLEMYNGQTHTKNKFGAYKTINQSMQFWQWKEGQEKIHFGWKGWLTMDIEVKTWTYRKEYHSALKSELLKAMDQVMRQHAKTSGDFDEDENHISVLQIPGELWVNYKNDEDLAKKTEEMRKKGVYLRVNWAGLLSPKFTNNFLDICGCFHLCLFDFIPSIHPVEVESYGTGS